MQRVIILRGVTASGKSTLAKRFRSFENKTVWLKIDNFKDFFDTKDIPQNSWGEIMPFVHGAANSSLGYLLDEGFSVVVDGVFQNPDFLEEAVEIVNKRNVPCKVFQLTVSLKTLQERDKVREGVPEGHRQPLGDETISQISKIVLENPYQGAIDLDTENMSIDECVDFIEKQFNNA